MIYNFIFPFHPLRCKKIIVENYLSTYQGVERKNKMYFWDYKKTFRFEPSHKTTCFTQYLSFLNSKEKDSSCKIDGFTATYTSKLKWKMGVAGLNLEPCPPNFENQNNFWRCSNYIKMIFWYLYWFQKFKDQCGVFRSYL